MKMNVGTWGNFRRHANKFSFLERFVWAPVALCLLLACLNGSDEIKRMIN